MFLGDVIYEYRMAHGKMSLREFAKLSNLSVAYVNQLENNRNPKTNEPIVPSLETFCKVAEAMNISLDDLLKKVDENQPVGINDIQRQAEPDLSGITNLSFPAAYPVPILGTICAGDGVLCEQNYEGEFFVDKRIKADYCLRVKGDSMIDAEIYDGDYAFIRKSYDYEDGHIYAVVYGTEQNASLKKLFRSEDNWILSPCNSAYAPILVTPDDMLIVGECVGVYHGVK